MTYSHDDDKCRQDRGRAAHALSARREPVVKDEKDLPRSGEVWKWGWLTVDIVKAGPKRVTWRDGTETGSTPTDRFLSRFYRTGLRLPPGGSDD